MFSCKTAFIVSNNNSQTLEIAQKHELLLNDSLEENNLPVVFTAANDSAINHRAENWFSKSKLYENKNKPLIKQYSPTKKNIKTNLSEDPASKKKKPTKWHWIPSIIILLASIVWLALSSFPVIGIIGIVLAIMVFASAYTNNSRVEVEVPQSPDTETALPQNRLKKKSKIWQIIASALLVLAGTAFVINDKDDWGVTGIAGIMTGLLLLTLALINKFAVIVAPKPNISENDRRDLPYNKYASLAGIFFLISLFLTIPPLTLLSPVAFFIAFIFSIVALIDISSKPINQRGKTLSIIIMTISALPIILVFTFFGVILVYGFGE